MEKCEVDFDSYFDGVVTLTFLVACFVFVSCCVLCCFHRSLCTTGIGTQQAD